MTRVFSAIDIEDGKVLDELVNVRESLDLGFNPVAREKMHITLQFFQEVDANEISKIKQGLNSVETEPFDLEIRGIGAFPSEDYIRVIWAGAPNEAVFQLYREVSRHDVDEDSKNEFKPHATLLRVKDVEEGRKKKLKRTMREFRDQSFGKIRVDSVKLFESVLNSEGTVYRELHEKEL